MSEVFVYIGTYTQENSEGIYIYKFNATNGSLEEAVKPVSMSNPSYQCFSYDKKYLYSVFDTDTFMSEPCGAVAAFSVDNTTGTLTMLNYRTIKGKGPCHLSVDSNNRYLFTANYSNGTVSQIHIENDGSLGKVAPFIQHHGSGPVSDRQEKAHAHFVSLTTDEKYLCAVDLGIDKVILYNFDPASGINEIASNNSISVRPGSGPRHLEFSADGKYMYVITELSCDIIVFEYDKELGRFSEIQTISTLPEYFTGTSYCSAIHMSSDGNYLYCSNRGHDSIAIFNVNKASGLLEMLECTSTSGNFPRDFAIDPTGNFMLVANQNSNTIYSFGINKATGRIEPNGKMINIPSPVCIKFLKV